MQRMIVEGAPVSAAIRNTAVDPMTARAYIYVGSALATYPGAGTRERSDALGMLIGVLNAYLYVLSAIRHLSIGASNFSEQLYQEFKLLRSRMKELGGADVAPVLVDLGLRELDMLSENADQIRVGQDAQLALCSDIEPFLGQADFSDVEFNERRAELLFNRARLKWMKGDFEAAERDAQESSNLYGQVGHSGAQPRLLQIDIARDAGNPGRALDLAVAAREYFSKRNERVGVLKTLGRLCQLLKRNLARLDEAIAYGTEGIELAKLLDDRGEESTFALDLAQLYLLKNRPQESVDMAKRALRLARRASSAVRELAVYGTLGQAYTKLPDLKSARWYIEQGLRRARMLNEPRREATFLNDLAAVEELKGHTATSKKLRFQAIDVAAELPSSESWTWTIGLLVSKAVATGDVGQCIDILTRGLGSFAHMMPHVAADASALLFTALFQFYVGFKPPRRSRLFADLNAQTSAIESRIGQKPAIGGEAAAVMAWGKILLLLSQGYRNEARQLVGELDVITGGKLNLTMIVERLSLL
jgi:tetratricopeptide (TPR) repeat protein